MLPSSSCISRCRKKKDDSLNSDSKTAAHASGIALNQSSENRTISKPVNGVKDLQLKRQFSYTEATKKQVIQQMASEEQATVELNFENGTVLESEVQKVISDFAELKNKQGEMQLYTTLTFKPIQLKNDTQVCLYIENLVQQNLLVEIRQGLLDHLRKQLKNNLVTLDILLVESGESKKTVFTPGERFERLAMKNEFLRELRKKLDLEIDY